MAIDISRMQAKVRKWMEWTNILNSISSDPDGKEFLADVFSTSANGTSAKSVLPRRSKKTAKRLDSIFETCSNFEQPFGLRELVEVLERKNFNFRRADRDVETGAALRRLVGENRLKVVREKVGKVGRLYQRVPP